MPPFSCPAPLFLSGVDVTVIQWKGGVAAAHYTVEIAQGQALGQKWEIDNGYAWYRGPWSNYRVGTPFKRSDYDPQNQRFVMYEPGRGPGTITAPSP